MSYEVPDDPALIDAELAVAREGLRLLAQLMLEVHREHPELPLPDRVVEAAVPNDAADLL